MNQSIQINNDLQIEYFEEGKGEKTILLIHGMGSDKKSWLKMISTLSKDLRIIAIDLPKYLNTDSFEGVELINYAKIIIQFMDAKEIPSVILCGHSMGAQISMHVALRYPKRVDQLILLAPAGLETFNEKDHQFFNQFATKKFYAEQTKEQVSKNFDVNFFGSQLPEDAKFMLADRMILMKDTIRYSRYLDYVVASVQSMLLQPVHSQLHNIQHPTLVIFGQQDLLIPNKIIHPTVTIEMVIQEADLIPHSKKVLIPRAGHFVMWDQAKKVGHEINQFTSDLPNSK